MARRCSVAVLLAGLVALAARGGGEPVAQGRLGADELLRQMADVYRTCRSYQDAGTVRVTFGMESPPRVEEQTFRTAFVRPDQFRFDYVSSPRTRATNTIWRSGPLVWSKYEFSLTAEKQESLSMAVAGATGVSNGVAHTIPALLMPDQVSGWRLTELGSVGRLEDEKLGPVTCSRIRGVVAGGLPVIVWLDSETYLIRRIDEQLPERFGATTTTLYEPSINGAVAVQPMDVAVAPAFRWGPLAALVLVLGGAAYVLWSRRIRRTNAEVGRGGRTRG